MAIVNGIYVTPNWTDGSAPAISADELKAIGQSIESNQTAINTMTQNITNNAGAIRSNTEALATASEQIADLKGATRLYTNISVPVAAWGASTTYAGFGYGAIIACTGVTTDYYVQVTFAPTEAMNGNYAPVATAGNNSITIYATQIPSAEITIPVIAAWAVVS